MPQLVWNVSVQRFEGSSVLVGAFSEPELRVAGLATCLHAAIRTARAMVSVDERDEPTYAPATSTASESEIRTRRRTRRS